jgi:hypothetical protein
MAAPYVSSYSRYVRWSRDLQVNVSMPIPTECLTQIGATVSNDHLFDMLARSEANHSHDRAAGLSTKVSRPRAFDIPGCWPQF